MASLQTITKFDDIHHGQGNLEDHDTETYADNRWSRMDLSTVKNEQRVKLPKREEEFKLKASYFRLYSSAHQLHLLTTGRQPERMLAHSVNGCEKTFNKDARFLASGFNQSSLGIEQRVKKKYSL